MNGTLENEAETDGAPDPQRAAARLYARHRDDGAWLDAFSESLDRCRAGTSLARVLAAWHMSQAEAARLFGVSRQAVGKWLARGVPPERARLIADLAAATDLLVRYLKRERIPAVVRRPVARLGNRSLLDLVAAGDSALMLATCREMFAFERASD